MFGDDGADRRLRRRPGDRRRRGGNSGRTTSAPAASRFKHLERARVLQVEHDRALVAIVVEKDAVNPPRRLAPARVESPPPGGSTLITSAPWSPRIIVPSGPATFEVRSTMRKPSSGPGILKLFPSTSTGRGRRRCTIPGRQACSGRGYTHISIINANNSIRIDQRNAYNAKVDGSTQFRCYSAAG